MRVSGRILLAVLVIFFVVALALQSPKVQTWAVGKTTGFLSDMLKTEVRIGAVDIDFFKTLVLEDIFLADQNQDTLLAARSLKVNIGILDLLGNEIHLNHAEINGATVKLIRQEGDSTFNYQFLIDAFTSEPNPADTTSGGFTFGIGNLALNGIHFDMVDEGESKFNLETYLGQLSISCENLDLDQQLIELEEVKLLDSDVAFRLLKNETRPDPAISKNSELTFPGFGWDISADEIRLLESHLAFSDENRQRNETAFDFSHLDLHQLSLPIDDFRYSDEMILGKIDGATFADHSGLQLNKLTVEVEIFDSLINATDLVIRTPQSEFQNDTRIEFKHFNNMTNFLSEVQMTSKFDEGRLAMSDLLLLAPDVKEIPNLQFPKGEMLRIKGGVFLENENLNLEGLKLSLGEETQLAASGKIDDLLDQPRFDLQVEEVKTNLASLQKFTEGIGLPEGLRKFGDTRISGNLKGTLNQLKMLNLKLETEASTRFSGDLEITGLSDVNTATFDLKVDELTSRSTDFSGFSETPLPAIIDSLGLIQFSGEYKGTITKFDIEGEFKTAAGQAATDLKMDFEKDYSDARYDGKLALQDFDLGQVLADTSQLGKVTFDLQLSGSGLDLDKLATDTEGTVQSLFFNGYSYQNIKVDGRVDKRQFSGNLGMEDPNLNFDFSGLANLNDSIPSFEFNLDLDTLNLAALNFYPEPLGLSGQMEARLRGVNIDDLDGRASLTNFAIESETEKYFDQKITLSARQLNERKRSLEFDANFLHAKVKGDYQFADLPTLVIGYVNDFFPVEELASDVDSTLSLKSKIAEQNFDFEIHFVGLTDVAKVFLPTFNSLDSSAYIKGTFDSGQQDLNLRGEFSSIDFDGIKADTFRLSANGNARRLKSNFSLHHFDLNGGMFASQINLGTHLGEDTLRFSLDVLDDSLGQDLHLAGRAIETQDDYHLSFDENFVLNKENWEIDEGNLIAFTNKVLSIRDLIFRKNSQSVGIATIGETPPEDIAPLELRFDNFRLREVSNLLNNPNLDLAGGLSGKFQIIEPLSNLHYNANLKVDSLHLNEELLGQLDVKAEQPRSNPTIELSVSLSEASELDFSGKYNVPEKRLDMRGDFQRLPITLADPFMVGLIEKSNGYLAGDFVLKGTPDEPILRGEIKTDDVSTFVPMAGTRFATDGGTVTISEKEIRFGDMVLTDPNGREAKLSGGIAHEFFDNIQLGIRAQTEGLQVLNTQSKDNPLYWGTIVAAADVRIEGTAEEPSLNITASTLNGTDLHVQPLFDDLSVVQEDYIIFADPSQFESSDSLQIITQKLNRKSGFDLTLRLQVTPSAELNVIIDPLTGDELFCRGNADLIVKMNPAGDIDITGKYVIEEGKYSFAYEGLVKRSFSIRQGSSLTFTGDPLETLFDITAVYGTRATTYELIANESSLDGSTLSGSRRRNDVNVLLNIDGDLAQPEITFDIELPQNQGGTVDNLVTRKLVSLREQPTEMNKQVFSLILFNSFLASESGAGLAVVGENAALRSVSNLVSSQLNRLAGRYLKGVDLSLGFESYRAAGEGAGTVSELNVGLSKQLFNDRLTIRVGGNFNLENSHSSQLEAGNTSSIAGDFVLEYKITEEGDYLLKVFHKSDYNALIDANTNKTGIGIMYRKSY